MKHNIRITTILLVMFLLTQFIGIYVISQYSPVTQTIINPQTGESKNVTVLPNENQLPYGQPPETNQQVSLFSIIVSLTIAILIIFLLMKFKLNIIIKTWFFIVIILSLGIAFYAFLKGLTNYALVVSLSVAIVLAIFKVYKPNIVVHNFTELLIYPGIAALIVPLLGAWSVIVLLVLISIYDMWAVWHSGIMQKMARYQMEEVGVFGGFLIPYIPDKLKAQMKKFRLSKSKTKNKKFKVQLAILGGGDVVFPIIASGVFFRTFGIVPALFVAFGAFVGLLFLLILSEKKKFYPAMPFISAGIFLGLLIWRMFLF